MPRNKTDPPTPHPHAEGFSQVPEGLLLPFMERLSKSEILVLLALMRYQREQGIYSRSASEIADVCGMTVGTVKNALSKLVGKGFLVRLSRGRIGHTAEFELASSLFGGVAEWLPKPARQAQRGSPDSDPNGRESHKEGHRKGHQTVTPKEAIETEETPPPPTGVHGSTYLPSWFLE